MLFVFSNELLTVKLHIQVTTQTNNVSFKLVHISLIITHQKMPCYVL